MLFQPYIAPQPSLTAHRLYSVSMRRPLPGMPVLLAAWPVHDMSCAAPLPDLCCGCCYSKAHNHFSFTLMRALDGGLFVHHRVLRQRQVSISADMPKQHCAGADAGRITQQGCRLCTANKEGQRAALTAAAVTAL